MVRLRNPDRQPGGRRAHGVVKSLAFGAAAFLLAGIVGMFTFAGVVRKFSPGLVSTIWHDPSASMAQWTNTVAAEPARLANRYTRDVSVAVLDEQPLNAPALWLLAAWEDMQRHPDRADRLAHLSEQVTRRHLMTQLFLLERAVSHEEINGALTHYDKALRVSPNSKQFLFPVLVAAMKDASIRDSLASYAGRQVPWIGGFLFSALDAQGGVVSTAELLLNSRVPADSPLLADLSANLLSRLFNQQQFALAELIFRKLPTARPSMLVNLSFSTDTTNPAYGPLGWQVTDNTDADIAFQRGLGGEQSLYISIPSAGGQTKSLVRRMVHLPTGVYRFAENRKIATSVHAPFWQIECAAASGQWSPLWRSTTEDGTVSIPLLRIPYGCDWQRISLVASSILTTETIDLTIDHITLQPAANDTAKRPIA